MKTIMIVDDEPLIRRGLESMIPWEELDYHLLGQASNGEEGLARIREWKPDVVFTDIKMPKMDGISMMKEAGKDSNPPIFVVLSGYDDFELVRSAMRLGAIDYLMKLNLDEADIKRVLNEAAEQLHDHKKEITVETADFKENFLGELLAMRDDKEFYAKMKEKKISLKDGYSYRLLCIKLPQPPQEQWKESPLARNFLLNICKEQIPNGIETYEYPVEIGVFAIYMESITELSKEMLESACLAMKSAVKKYMNLETIMGISASHHNVMHIFAALEEAMHSIIYQISGEGRQLHFYTDMLNAQYFIKQLTPVKTAPDLTDMIETFILQLQTFIAQRATKEEAVYICFHLITKVYDMDSKSIEFFTNWFGKTYRTEKDFENLDSLSTISRWLLKLQQGLISFTQQYMGEIYRFKVKKAMQLIFENRFRKISLNEVAEDLEITPSYLSRIFKKVTQKSFSDYIAEVKIEEAKKLLLQDNNRIYEVSNQLGYDDPYYFSKVFKKVTQLTPSEYISRN